MINSLLILICKEKNHIRFANIIHTSFGGRVKLLNAITMVENP